MTNAHGYKYTKVENVLFWFNAAAWSGAAYVLGFWFGVLIA